MTTQALTPDEVLRRLAEPLESDEVRRRKIPGGGLADYLSGADVILELGRVFGPLGWSHELVTVEREVWPVEDVDRKTGEVRQRWDAVARAVVRLTLHPAGWLGVAAQHADVGHGAPQGAMPDKLSAVEQAEKGAATDALKRAARVLGARFGLAFYLPRSEREGLVVPPGTRAPSRQAEPDPSTLEAALLDTRPKAAEPEVEQDGRVVLARWLLEGRLEPPMVREAVRAGSVPGKAGDLLEGKLPPDPTLAELAGLGLEDEQVAELAGYPADQVLDVGLLRTVALAVGRALGKAEVTRLWAELGVQLAPGVKVTGYLARLMAAAAAVYANREAAAAASGE